MKTYHEISKIENSMINLYKIAEKVVLINPFRPPHKKLPYTALFYRTMTLKVPFFEKTCIELIKLIFVCK